MLVLVFVFCLIHLNLFQPVNASCSCFISIGNSMICRDIAKLLYVISRTVRRVN